MKPVMCNCSACKRGRKNAFNQASIKQKRSGKRCDTRSMLRHGLFDSLPEKIYIGYTD